MDWVTESPNRWGTLHHVEIDYVELIDNIEVKVFWATGEGETRCVMVNLDLDLAHGLLAELAEACHAAEPAD